MLAAQTVCQADEPAPELICCICLDTWKDPVEVQSCGHIFCRGCIGVLAKCPECRSEVHMLQQPNRILVRLAEQVRVRCGGCDWTGTRESSVTHRCFEAPKRIPSGAAPHKVDDKLEEELAAYFLAFGGTPHDNNAKEVSLDRRSFFELLRCFNYAESPEDMEKIFKAVRSVSGETVQTSSRDTVSVHGLCVFLSKYPADPKRLYQLPVGEYHSAMYALYKWFESGNRPKLPRNEQFFTGAEFIEFAIERKQLPKPKDDAERRSMESHWMDLVDVVDQDGKVSRHEMLRFLSSCFRGSSMRADNLKDGLATYGSPALHPSRHPVQSKSCCSMQ